MKNQNNWHLMSSSDVLRDLSVDMYKGLSREEVKKRKRKYGSNSVWHVKKTSASDVLFATIFDLATLILVISVVLAVAFDKKYEAGAIALILVIGGILRAATYIRATRILEDIAKEKIPSSSVIRDGEISLVSASEIVLGDIIFLDAGDTVPCDGRVLTGEDSVVSERGITENKTSVHKFNTIIETESEGGEIPCEFRSNMLFAGSSVISGPLRMAATSCGDDTLISMKQGGIEIVSGDKIPVIEKLGVRSRNTSLVMLACVMIFTAVSIFLGETSLADVFLCTMSMAVAAMSEFLTTIGYIIVAVTLRDPAERVRASDTAKSRVVIRDPEIIESLASLERIVFCGSSFFKSGNAEILAYRFGGEYVGVGEEYPNDNMPGELLGYALAASAVSRAGVSVGGEKNLISSFAEIVKQASEAYSEKIKNRILKPYPIIEHIGASEPMSSGLDSSLTMIDDSVWLVSCGSIDDIMSCCSSYKTKDGSEPMNEEMRKQIFTECAKLEFGGAKVIAVAMRQSPFNSLNRISVLTQYMNFVGFFAVSQMPEKNALENVSYLKRLGIVPIMFSENPEGDLYYCHRLKLFGKKTKIIHAKDLTADTVLGIGKYGAIISFEGIDPSYIAGAYSRAMKTVMGNISDDKSDISLQKHKSESKTTAAIGRETYEAGVISKADIGITAAQYEFRGAPEILSKNSSVIVHASSDTLAENGGLDGLVKAVKSAGRILANIESAKFYLTASQCARLVLILAAVLWNIPLISTVFILVWGLIFDFAAVLVMAFEHSDGNENIALNRRDDEDTSLVFSSHKNTIASVVYGVLWGILLSLILPICDLISPDLTGGLTTLSAAVVLSLAATSIGVVRRGRISFSKKHSSVSLGIFAAVSAIFSLVLMFTDFGAEIAGGTVCPVISLIPAVVPAVVIITAVCTIGYFSNQLSKKR